MSEPRRTLRVIEFGNYLHDGEVAASYEEANAISSDDLVVPDMHWPCIDIDHPIRVVPSSTVGHFHLYIDVPFTGEAYFKLLDDLVDAGLVEHGFAQGSRRRGHSDLRLPHIKKGDA